MSIHAVLQDPELREYYDALFQMYASPGWKNLMEDVEFAIEQNDTVSGIETAEQLHFRKGELNQMLWLRNHQAAHEHAYVQLLEKQNGDADPLETGGRAKVVNPESEE